jgi:hypothetical protein
MITEKITYNSLLELGFKREDVDDSVWKGETGFDYFIVSKDYGSYIFSWDIYKYEISIEKIFQNGTIVETKKIKKLSVLKDILEKFDFWQKLKNLGESKKEKIFENLKNLKK